jgi:hypothetical protein
MWPSSAELSGASVEGSGGTLDILPRRIFLASPHRPRVDDHGFVLRLLDTDVVSALDLLQHSAALIVAPPWTGKTFISEQLDAALNLGGQLHKRVSFERPATSLRPAWWDDWLSAESPAWWIVDAIDEDERRGDCRTDEILELFEDLPKEARSRLHILFFCRESEEPQPFLSRAERLFGAWSATHPAGLRRLRLAGLDRESARDHVGAEAFERVCRLIEVNGLQEIAALPSVLKHLGRVDPDQPLERLEIWRGLLKDLLRERPGRASFPVFRTEVEERFEVVQWLAAVLTFSGQRELRNDAPGSGPDLETLIPSGILGWNLQNSREAARESLRTAVFEPAGDGFRFAQDHVREWFAALALKDMLLVRARPLLTIESGKPTPVHTGFMDLLGKVAVDPELRNWIEQAHGGLVPPSGTVPWTLAEAIRALDKLQEWARTSPWGLALWHEERLARLAAPRLGAEITHRLEGLLSPAEQELLLDVALAVGAPEPLQLAIHIVRDRERESRVRTRAADVVAKLGGSEELEALEPWVRSKGEDDIESESALSILVAAFFRKDLWDFETTASFALSRKTPGHDWLQYLLAEELSLDRARQSIVAAASSGTALSKSPLARRAIEIILEQREPSDADWDLLQPLAFRSEESDSLHGDMQNLFHKFEQSPGIRRKIFLEGLTRDPKHELEGAWRWRSALRGDDVEWLLEIISSRSGEPNWLCETLYILSLYKGVSRAVRLKVLRALKAWDPEQLRQLDRVREKGHRKEARRRKRAAGGAQVYEIASLVRSTLDDSALTLYQKMLRLSWSCFVKPSFRPANVSGRWEDLAENLRGEVMVLCRKALEESDPTPIHEGASYPSRLLWEEACFEKLLLEYPEFVLTSQLIRKWLPAVLRCWESDWKLVLQRCIGVDRELSEDLIFEAVLRDLRSGSSYTAQELLPEMWSERLAVRFEQEAVLVPDFSEQARIDLLRRIARIYPGRAVAVAKRWTGESSVEPELRDAGIDILFAADPVEGWLRLTPLFQQEGAMPVLLRMRFLQTHHWGPAAEFDSWPANVLEPLAACLIEALPPGGDPVRVPGEAYSIDREEELRYLRDSIPARLFRRKREGDAEALERLAKAYPSVRDWLDQTRAQEGAEGVLAGLSGGWPVSPGSIPVERVVRLLQDARYRLLRTADDLQAVVLEELQAIAADAKNHLAMLYRPLGKKQGRQRLWEDALQAYLHCRLTDRLSKGTLDPRPRIVFLNREPLAARNTRNDIKIQTTSLDGKPLTLIIEIKWSDNADVSTSLVEQLGKGYLKENGLTHGIYFVGWCGHSTPEFSLDSWRARLEEQARLFQTDQPDLKISPFLLDLTWELSSETSATP